jgi:hypothetical protein
VSVTKIFSDGKGLSLGKKVAQLYFLTTMLAVLNGVFIAMLFGGLFTSNNDDDDEEGADIELICPAGVGKVTVDASGQVLCLRKDAMASLNLTEA